MLNLYCEYFYSEDLERREEYHYCIDKNIRSGIFSNINYVVSSCKIPKFLIEAENSGVVKLHYDRSDLTIKDEIVYLHNCENKRATFKDLFCISDICTKKTDINIISNLDIWFDESIKLLENRLTAEMAVGLSRWYEPDDYYMVAGLHMDGKAAPGSNDVWAWVGECRLKNANFPLGYTACDSKLMRSFEDHGYRIFNPAKSIKTWHRHKGRGPTPPMVEGPYLDVPLDHNSIEDLR